MLLEGGVEAGDVTARLVRRVEDGERPGVRVTAAVFAVDVETGSASEPRGRPHDVGVRARYELLSPRGRELQAPVDGVDRIRSHGHRDPRAALVTAREEQVRRRAERIGATLSDVVACIARHREPARLNGLEGGIR